MGSLVNKIKGMMDMNEQQSKGLIQQVDEAVTLTWKQRLIGFGVCISIGLLLSLVGVISLWTANVVSFAIFYSLGNVVSICSTLFLMGPIQQVKRMFEQHRILATLVFLVSIGVTLLMAFKFRNAAVCMIFLVIQFLALCWYCLTWIPGGQAMLKGLVFRGSG